MHYFSSLCLALSYCHAELTAGLHINIHKILAFSAEPILSVLQYESGQSASDTSHMHLQVSSLQNDRHLIF